MIGALIELGRRYRYDHLPDRESYAQGIRDGEADAADDGAHERTRKLDSFRDQLNEAFLHYGRATRAYTVGYVRAYRAECGVGGRIG